MVARNMSGIAFGVANDQAIVRTMQSELTDMRAEGSGAVMVLSMNIVGDRSADGDEARAGSDRKKPSLRKKHIDDIGEGDAAFAAKHSGRFVEAENAVEAAAIDQLATSVEAGIAVAAA